MFLCLTVFSCFYSASFGFKIEGFFVVVGGGGDVVCLRQQLDIQRKILHNKTKHIFLSEYQKLTHALFSIAN